MFEYVVFADDNINFLLVFIKVYGVGNWFFEIAEHSFAIYASIFNEQAYQRLDDVQDSKFGLHEVFCFFAMDVYEFVGLLYLNY